MTVNDSALRLAMREMQSRLRRPGTPLITVAVIGVLAISGPFGTVESMNVAVRLLYWGVIVVVTLYSGWFASLWLVHGMIRRGWGKPAIWALVSLVVAVIVALEVAIINVVAFGIWPATGETLLSLLVSTVPITLIVTAVFTWGPTVQEPAPEAPPAPQPPRLLARLPFDKRGPLVALSVQDHYVAVVTTKGRDFLLMRLSDAIAETEGCPGLQVHRSHWVALGQVRAARRDGARGVLTMAGGLEIPVSRSFLPNAKEAGLL